MADMSNYPPGVTGNEREIAGDAAMEAIFERLCETPKLQKLADDILCHDLTDDDILEVWNIGLNQFLNVRGKKKLKFCPRCQDVLLECDDIYLLRTGVCSNCVDGDDSPQELYKNAYRVSCWDFGDTVADRYTVLFLEVEDDGNFVGIGMSESPRHPQGFGQHLTALPGEHLGEQITFFQLPLECQDVVLTELKDIVTTE